MSQTVKLLIIEVNVPLGNQESKVMLVMLISLCFKIKFMNQNILSEFARLYVIQLNCILTTIRKKQSTIQSDLFFSNKQG